MNKQTRLCLALLVSVLGFSQVLSETVDFNTTQLFKTGALKTLNDFDIGDGSGGTATADLFAHPEHIKRQNVEERLAAHSDNLLGDSLDINTGSIAFEHVDVRSVVDGGWTELVIAAVAGKERNGNAVDFPEKNRVRGFSPGTLELTPLGSL